MLRALFIDFKRAYDSFKEGYMFQAMEVLGMSKKLIQLIEATFGGNQSCVKNG